MHHSSNPDPEMADRVKEAFEKDDELKLADRARHLLEEGEQLGATGLFPDGKFNEFDEGEIRFRAAHVDGKIVVDFGKPVAWLGMSSNQAKDFARLLLQLANPVTR